MGVVKNLMVRAGADFSAITKQASRVKGSMRGMQESVSKSCSRMSAAASGVNRVFQTIGVTLSIAAFTAFAKSAKDAYNTQIEGETRLAQVMRNTIGATKEEIQSVKDLLSVQQQQGVIGDEIQLAGAQELATYVSMTSTLKRLIPVMNDMAAQQYGLGATAENVTNIATMLGKVMSGQTGGLSRYGYYFTKAQEEILKYGTEAQRAAVLTEVVTQSVGGMNAALAATPSGRLQQVSNTLGDIKETFGQAVARVLTVFLPAMNAVCSVLASVATLANKVAQAIANVFGGGASHAAAAVQYTAAATGAMEDFTESTKAAGAAAKENLGTFGFDTLQKLSGSSSSGAGSGSGEDSSGGLDAGGLITETTAGADEAGETIGWLEKGLARLKETAASLNFDNLANAFAHLKAAAAPLKDDLFQGLKWGYDHVLEPLAHWTVESALPAFLGVLAEAANVLHAALKALQPLGLWLWDKFLQPLAKWTGSIIIKALNGIAKGLHAVSEWISQHQGIVQAFAVVVGSFAAAWGLVNTALKAWNTAATAAALAAKIFGAAFAFLTSPIGAVTVAIGAVIAVVILLAQHWDTLKAAGAAAWEGIKAAWSSAKEWFASSVVEPLKSAWNAGMEQIKIWGAAAWEGIKTAWSSAKEWFASSVVEPLKSAWNAGMEQIKTWGAAAWEGIKAAWSGAKEWFASSVIEPLKSAWNAGMEQIKIWGAAAWEGIKTAWSGAKEWFASSVVEPLKSAWNAGMEQIKTWGAAAWAGVQNAWSSANNWFSGTVVEPVKSTWHAGMEQVKTWGAAAWEGIKTAWSGASGWFSHSVITPLSSGFRSFANGILGFFEGIANGAISGVNSIVHALNRISFDIPEWVPVVGGRSFGFHLPTVSSVRIPRLANGAVFEGNDPYLAIVNDQKHGTNVETPLDTMIEAMMTALRQSDFGNGEVSVNVKAVFEGQLAALARCLRPYFEAEAARVGTRASTAWG